MSHQEDINYLWNNRENARPNNADSPINSVRFVLPTMPVSVNSLYEVWWQTREVKKSRDYWRWATDAKGHMPPFKLRSADSFICVDVVFYYNFYTKEGKLRKYDTHNLMKALIDTIASRYGFRDERVKRCPTDSLPSKQERAIVTVSEYRLDGGELEIKKGE